VATFSDLFARLDPEPWVRGMQFERICKRFLTNDPRYKALLRRVWLWKEWPDRWSDTEAGIDLVAKDVDGHLWAIQAKAYAEDRPIPKRELDKFLSESNRPIFSYRLLISTTSEGLHRIAQGTVDAQEKPVFILERPDLEKSPVQWPTSPDDLRPSPPAEPAQPRDYQEDAIRDVVGGFATADRGQLLMACGTGKTLTAWFITDKLAADRTMVLVPSLSLLKQTMREWQNSTGGKVQFASLPVCSDPTVTQHDEAPVHTCDLGVPVKTDPADIAAFLRERGRRVVFATYQSSPQVAKAFELGGVPAFDLVIADEAHRCAGPVSSYFATILDSDKIKAKRRLFMTATPRVYSESTKRTAKDEDFEYASMDDRERFGEVFHKLGFSQAIERKLLTDYQVAVIGVDDATYREWAERGTFVTLDGKTPVSARTLAGQIGLAKAMGKYDLRRTISFHSYVSRARDFAASMEKVIAWMPPGQRPAGSLWARYASGEMDAGKRSRLIRRLAALDDGERGLLSNARCLAEGVDVPTLDGVAFIDPRRSEVDIIQAVGRAIRKADNKKVGTVVIPVFIDTDANPEVALSSSTFKPVWDVIRALRSHDEALGKELDGLRRELGRHGGIPRLPSKIHIDIPKKVDAAFAEAFEVRLVEQTTASWEFWMGLMDNFIQQNGHSLVRIDYTVGEYRLGSWVSTQRHLRGKGELSEERTQRLQALPGWSWDAVADSWTKHYNVLKSFAEREGHARPPQPHVENGLRLGQWVAVVRRSRDVAAQENIALLEALPGWSWNPYEDDWEQGFTSLLKFVEREGHAGVAKEHIEDGYYLGRWTGHQRAKRKSLSLDRQQRLEALPGWSWDLRADMWQRKFNLLRKFQQREGHALVPQGYAEDGAKLGSWVGEQRNNEAKLSGERRKLLESVPGWTWDPYAESWERGFDALTRFAQREGHARAPQGHMESGLKLGSWVTEQRVSRQKMSAERRARLEAIRGWSWNAVEDSWMEHLDLLKAFAAREGHARVPVDYIENGLKLGQWTRLRRREHKKLSPERQALLNAIPGWYWGRSGDFIWDQKSAVMKKFVDREGHARVPKGHIEDGVKLGAWVAEQRAERCSLSPERVAQLEALPGWSWTLSQDIWDERYELLGKFADREGHARVPQNYVEDGANLGKWVGVQRQKRDKLTAERRARLDSVPGWSWDPHADQWEKAFHILETYAEEHHTTRVPYSYEVGDFKLGVWVYGRRSQYTKGKLDTSRQRRLEGLPGWTWNLPGGSVR
jgi:superfamily II DNA or RNA helicase